MKTKKQIVFCPHCKKDLSKVGIGFSQSGEMLYKVWSDGENLQYDTDEFGDADGGEFFCKDCNAMYIQGLEEFYF